MEVNETKDAIKTVMSAFEEFKSVNDARLVQIEAKGSADPLIEEKLSRINATLDLHEAANQKLTSLEATKTALADLEKKYDALELSVKRSVGNAAPESKEGRVSDWGHAVVNAHLMGIPNLSEVERKTLEDIRAEYKSLSVSTDTAGGYLAPIELVREIIKGETEMSPVRSLARVRQTAAKAIQIPKRTGQFAAAWVAEQGTKAETTGLTYGMWEIPTHEFYALIDISNQMLEDSGFNMEAEITEESVEQFAVAEGTAFVTGDGIGKPQGFMSTAAGVATTNSGAATTVTADGLLTLKHAIKTSYTRNANFVMNRTTLGSVRKLKDSNNQYLWITGIAAGKPNTIDGDPYQELTDMPSEGAGLKPVAYGDFRRAYTWVDRIQMEMLRDPYTQATSGNVRFIMRKRVGGQVTLAEAIRTLTCST